MALEGIAVAAARSRTIMETSMLAIASSADRDPRANDIEEEHTTLLSREVDHRSRNLLALVQATVNLAQGDTPVDLKKAIGGRIQALANVHALLAQSHWTGADIRSLVTAELSPYCAEGESRTEFIGPTLLLKPKSAQSIAVMLHELTTNAVKYGALSVSAGRIQVEWSLAADGKLVIVWTESNGPPVKPPSRRGFGSRVIEQVANGELKGEARFDWRGEGLVCKLTLEPTVGF